MKKKILLTGGGTAGHVWPVIMVANLLLEKEDTELLYVGANHGIEKELILETKIPFKSITVGKRRNYFSFWNVWDLFKTFVGLIQGFYILITFRPDIIFSKGGYVTFPILFWAKLLKSKVIIHESDAVIGRANLWAAKFARKICVGFPIEYYGEQAVEKEKLIFTGIPIKDEFFKEGTPSEQILVTGGSQGSVKINQFFLQILPELKDYKVIHITGKRSFMECLTKKSAQYEVYEFTYKMAELMTGSKIIVSRAGASTLAEIAAAKKPAIIIPLATSANSHQQINAKIFAEHKAAIVLDEEQLEKEILLNQIKNLMHDTNRQKELAENIGFFAQKDAAETISNLLLKDEI